MVKKLLAALLLTHGSVAFSSAAYLELSLGLGFVLEESNLQSGKSGSYGIKLGIDPLEEEEENSGFTGYGLLLESVGFGFKKNFKNLRLI